MQGHVETKEKQNITLYPGRQVIEKAKETGLNISKHCEISLITAIEALELNQKTRAFLVKVLGAPAGI